jgi:pyruvate/2-oxoglutarate dehydrogenase complex dihydrolipoamide dehydrogenase (E3) component
MPSFKKHYDYIVIGAGSGGLLVGVGLKKLKKDVLMVGKDIGGECTHTGCIPSKTFLSLAMHYVMKSQKLCNVELRQGIFDRIREKVAELERHDKSYIKENDIPFIQGMARFVNENTIEAEENGKKYKITFNTCIISTGSSPQKIPIEGLPADKILTNDTLFKIKELPERVVIFGGGPIGTEIGTAFSKFCTHTTIIVRSKMIPQEPPECVAEVRKSLVEEYNADLYEKIKDIQYDKKTGKLHLFDENKKEVARVQEADYYLMALGRIPNTRTLDLENAGVRYEKDGIMVDKNLQTSNSRIFAMGDVIQGPKFTHLAMHHGRYLIKKALIPWTQRNETPLPACTFSDPPISSVGEKEETGSIKRFVVDFSKSDRGIVEEVKGLKGVIYVEMSSGHIKGASIVGHFGEHAINFFTLAIIKEMSVWEFESFMVPYPTYFSGIEKLYYQFLGEYARNWKKYLLQRIVQRFMQLLPLLSLAGIIMFLLIGSYLYET